MKYFQVKFGFGDNEFVSIDETELKRAIIAQTTGKIGIFNEGTVTGDKIIAIVPDVNKMMGWNRTYKPTSEDLGEISEKTFNEYRILIEKNRAEITGIAPKQNPPKEISEQAKQLSEKFSI